ICSRLCGYSGSVQFTSRQRSMLRVSASSFSARLKDCFLKTACATGAGNRHASRRVSGARNTSSGEPNSRSNRAESREASPGVSASASQEREASGSIATRAYSQINPVVNYSIGNYLLWCHPDRREGPAFRRLRLSGILLENFLQRPHKQIRGPLRENQRRAQL